MQNKQQQLDFLTIILISGLIFILFATIATATEFSILYSQPIKTTASQTQSGASDAFIQELGTGLSGTMTKIEISATGTGWTSSSDYHVAVYQCTSAVFTTCASASIGSGREVFRPVRTDRSTVLTSTQQTYSYDFHNGHLQDATHTADNDNNLQPNGFTFNGSKYYFIVTKGTGGGQTQTIYGNPVATDWTAGACLKGTSISTVACTGALDMYFKIFTGDGSTQILWVYPSDGSNITLPSATTTFAWNYYFDNTTYDDTIYTKLIAKFWALNYPDDPIQTETITTSLTPNSATDITKSITLQRAGTYRGVACFASTDGNLVECNFNYFNSISQTAVADLTAGTISAQAQCASANIVGEAICKSLVWLFYPTTTSIENWTTDLPNQLKNKIWNQLY